MRRRARMRVLLAAASLAVLVLLAGCASSGGVSQLYNGQGSVPNYVSSDGWAVTVAASQRTAPVSFSGPLVDSGTFDSSSTLGQVVVVNFWYAQCPPCRTEAPDLEKLAQQYGAKGVTFIGVNTLDTAALAQTFEKDFSVTYPSILDVSTNNAQLAFAGNLAIKATPSTVVLDKKGRIAARFSGSITTNSSVVGTVIADALAES